MKRQRNITDIALLVAAIIFLGLLAYAIYCENFTGYEWPEYMKGNLVQ